MQSFSVDLQCSVGVGCVLIPVLELLFFIQDSPGIMPSQATLLHRLLPSISKNRVSSPLLSFACSVHLGC